MVVTGHAEAEVIPAWVGRIVQGFGQPVRPRLLRTSERPRERIRKRGGLAEPVRKHLEIVQTIGTLRRPYSLLVIDDLEHDDRAHATPGLQYWRNLLQGFAAQRDVSVGVHFLVNMLEAYFFAQASKINEHYRERNQIELSLRDHLGDVENLPSPKGTLKDHIAVHRGCGYSETDDGVQISRRVDLKVVLQDPMKCRSLRTLVAWIHEQAGQPRGDDYQLANGQYWDVTVDQLRERPPAEQIGPLGAEEKYSG